MEKRGGEERREEERGKTACFVIFMAIHLWDTTLSEVFSACVKYFTQVKGDQASSLGTLEGFTSPHLRVSVIS